MRVYKNRYLSVALREHCAYNLKYVATISAHDIFHKDPSGWVKKERYIEPGYRGFSITMSQRNSIIGTVAKQPRGSNIYERTPSRSTKTESYRSLQISSSRAPHLLVWSGFIIQIIYRPWRYYIAQRWMDGRGCYREEMGS